jgi:hypothetical protein
MKDIVHDLSITASFLQAELVTAEKTAASALRARKLTLELEKLGKQFRAKSVKFHKK